ncbi:MAG: porin family protein [Pseudomonadales bacterium]|nr:porin family protein [Pseudomonadales bacterium]
MDLKIPVLSTKILVLALIASISVISVPANAAGLKKVKRTGTWEATFLLRNQSSETYTGAGGFSDDSISFDSDMGFGFSFGYNFDQHLSLGLEFSGNRPRYTAEFNDENGDPQTLRREADAYATMFKLRYHFLDGPIQPFVSGGLGWTGIDSNIGTGNSYCSGYYYWYCYEDTFGTWGVGYTAEVGVRMDLPNRLFLRGSYGRQWSTKSIGSESTPSFDVGNLELGVTF